MRRLAVSALKLVMIYALALRLLAILVTLTPPPAILQSETHQTTRIQAQS
eukprot:SAG31_NODE_25573_length_458_cov_12.732591_1_plen_49_part_01